MLRSIALLALGLLSATPVLAIDQRAISQLQKLDPAERLQQRCDVEAMERIRHDQNAFRPDKVISYTFAEPQLSGDAMKAPGAVFRSGGDWYKLKYKCATSANNIQVKSFEYKLGGLVPRSDWTKYYLYD